jgi:hypothetical protein
MTALNFQARFAASVADGTKRQTIRAERKDGRMPCRTGHDLHLYTGMRTQSCRRLRTAICTSIWRFEISRNPKFSPGIRLGGVVLNREETIALAQADGFTSVTEMVEWFRNTHGLPFSGWLIKWDEVTS